MVHDDRGREIPDQTPLEIPLHFKRPTPLNDLVKQLIRTEFSRQAQESGQESWDEANDFAVEDDEFPVSAHEILDDEEFRSVEQEMLDRAAKDMENERAGSMMDQHTKESKDGEDRGRREGVESRGSNDGEKRGGAESEKRGEGGA